MKSISAVFLILISICFCQLLNGQHLFTEHDNWGKKESDFIPKNVTLRHDALPDSIAKGDSVLINFTYPNGNKAIEGLCIGNQWEGLSKRGIWNYYYEDGTLWSTRQYSKRTGRLVEITSLKTINGEDLDHGYARRIGKNKIVNGQNYIYKQNGEVDSIATYFQGNIVQVMAKNDCSQDELNRLIIRKYKIDEENYLEELSIEEAIKFQKENYKPIVVNATTTWNGWSKKGVKILSEDPTLAKFIDDNFYYVYLDIEDTRPIEIEYKGETKIFPGSKGKISNGFLNEIAGGVRTTPTFIFLDADLNVLHKNVGVEVKDGGIMKQMNYFLSGEYENMTWKEYDAKF